LANAESNLILLTQALRLGLDQKDVLALAKEISPGSAEGFVIVQECDATEA